VDIARRLSINTSPPDLGLAQKNAGSKGRTAYSFKLILCQERRNTGVNTRVKEYGLTPNRDPGNPMNTIVVLLATLLSVPCIAQTGSRGTIFVFRRHYAALTKPSVYIDGVRVARMQSASFFSIKVGAGIHRLGHNLDFHSNRSVNSEEEATDIDVPTNGIVCIEMTFADARGFLKHARFTPVPPSIAKDHLQELHPLDAKWIFDKRVSIDAPNLMR